MGNGTLAQEEIDVLLRGTFKPVSYKTEDSVKGSVIGCHTLNMEWFNTYRTSNTSSGSGPRLRGVRKEARSLMHTERADGFRTSDSRTFIPSMARSTGRSGVVHGTCGISPSMDKPAPVPSMAPTASVHPWISLGTSCAVAGYRTLAWIAGLGAALVALLPAKAVYAAGLTLDLGNTAGQQMSTSLLILLLLTVLSIAPAILILMTSFTRIIIILSFVRNALGTQQLPPNQVLIGLSLFLTFFVMAPTWNQINTQALQPYLHNQISQSEALSKAEEPLRTFMFKQTRVKDLQLFISLAKMPQPKTYGDIPTYVLIPAFIISELKTAFQMGFAIFIPFMVIDMIVSSTLMSMGMLMLPPMTISLPFKILLFVLVDGWHLVVQSIVTSFH